MEKLRLGRVTGAVGLKGELRVYPYTDYKEKFEEIDYVLMDDLRFSIENVRYMKEMAILKLSGIDDRTAAEACKGKDLFLFRKDAPPLPEDTYYVKDLIGLSVVDEDGKCIGRLKEVILNEAQDIYMIEPEDGGKPFPVPAVNEFIKEVDLQKGTITVRLIEGLREL
ncbi:MAG: ribosome maturation factor RimM [Anaerovoracaceae bacterium]